MTQVGAKAAPAGRVGVGLASSWLADVAAGTEGTTVEAGESASGGSGGCSETSDPLQPTRNNTSKARVGVDIPDVDAMDCRLIGFDGGCPRLAQEVFGAAVLADQHALAGEAHFASAVLAALQLT